MRRKVRQGLRQRLRQGWLKGAVTAALQPLQTAARQALVQIPGSLRPTDPVQTAMQYRGGYGCQGVRPLKQC